MMFMVLHKIQEKMLFKVKQKIKQNSMVFRAIEICLGFVAYSFLRWNFGNKSRWIILRGATGDLYLQFLLLDAYLKIHRKESCVVIGDSSSFSNLAKVFSYSDTHQYPLTVIECLETWYLFSGKCDTKITIPFIWSYNNWINKCRIRMDDRFTFMDTYTWMSFSLAENDRRIYKLPHFAKSDTEPIKFLCESMGVTKGNTVWIAPDANSITGFPPWFWNMLIHALQDKGYTVFMNCGEPNFYRAPSRILPYKACVPVLEYSGYFLGLRSGLCDIISTADCKKVILYPERQPAPDYGNHRSEAEFSSLVRMNLSDASPDLVELSTPLLQNITDDDSQLLTRSKSYFDAMQTLHDDILRYF